MYEDFLNYKLYIEISKEDKPYLSKLENVLGNRKFAGGERIDSLFTERLLDAYLTVGLCCEHDKIYYSSHDYKTRHYVTLKEFFNPASLEVDEDKFKFVFEG